MEKNLNNNIPNDIKNKIRENGKEQSIDVFRIAKSGRIDETTFLNSYEEILLGHIENKDINDFTQEQLNNIGLYGTSCNMTYKKAKKSLKMFMKHYPFPLIIKGKSIYGLSQKTYERTGQVKDKDHLDWWIYDKYNNNSKLNFKEYVENHEEDGSSV